MNIISAAEIVNNTIPLKSIRFGWKVEINKFRRLELKYTAVNFDWQSINALNFEQTNIFLNSDAYLKIKQRIAYALRKFKRINFEAATIFELQCFIEQYNLKVNVERLVHAVIEKKSKQLKEKYNKSK